MFADYSSDRLGESALDALGQAIRFFEEEIEAAAARGEPVALEKFRRLAEMLRDAVESSG